jgi:hypothetical protein
MGNTAPKGTLRTQAETAPQAAEYDNHSAQDAPSRVSSDAKAGSNAGGSGSGH